VTFAPYVIPGLAAEAIHCGQPAASSAAMTLTRENAQMADQGDPLT
jgi:hypothetical protein